MVDNSASKEMISKEKGKGKEFTPFVVGGSTIENAIEIVEVEDDVEHGEVTNN